MPVRRDPRTGHWFFRTRVTFPDGRRDRISGTPGVSGLYHNLPQTKAGAQEAERRAITKAMTGLDVRPETKEVVTIREYSTPFLDGYAASHKAGARRDKKQRLNAYILPAVGHLRLDELRQEHVDAIVRDMLAKDLGRKGINTTLSVLSSLIGYAVTNGLIADPELKFTIQSQDAELVAVPATDVVKLLAVTTDRRYRVALLLAADAGLRIGEIRALPWSEVNELAREITIAWSYDRRVLSETKGWERRTVPISARLWLELQSVKRDGPLVFARLDGKPLGYDVVRDTVQEIYAAAKIDPPKMPWHALRHTFGTELANSGAAIQTIRELMGHKSIETTMRYLHTTRDQKRDAIKQLVPRGSHWAAERKSTTN